MLKALLLLLMNLALAAMATAQTNLVPNGSFEDTVSCEVHGLYSLLTSAHWSSPNLATPDVYDCDLERQCGDPMDPEDTQGVLVQGYQAAYEGSRFAAGFQWYGPGVPAAQDTRDYLMVRLTDPLESGRSYAVSLFYSRAEGYKYAVANIGVYFGYDSVYANHPVVLDLDPQVVLRDPLEPYLIEGDGWVQLADTFVASGGEEWMIIGTFDGSDEVDGTNATPQSNFSYAYYYMDEVAVRPLDRLSVIPDLAISNIGAGSLQFIWRGTSPISRLRVFDATGRLFMDSSTGWMTGEHMLELSSALATGVYLVEGWSASERWVVRFVKRGEVY